MNVAAIVIRVKWNGHKDKRFQKCQLSHTIVLFLPAKVENFPHTPWTVREKSEKGDPMAAF